MKLELEFSATYVASSGRGEVAVWLNGDLFLVLPADYLPDLDLRDAEEEVIRRTLLTMGDRLQDLLDGPE